MLFFITMCKRSPRRMVALTASWSSLLVTTSTRPYSIKNKGTRKDINIKATQKLLIQYCETHTPSLSKLNLLCFYCVSSPLKARWK